MNVRFACLPIPAREKDGTLENADGADICPAHYLGVEVGRPVLDHEVQVLDPRGRVLIFGSSLYHADRFVYALKVKAPQV